MRWQSFNQKKPYFIATVFSVVAMAFAVGFLFSKLADVKKEQLAQLQAVIHPQQQDEQRFNRAYTELKNTKQELDQVTSWIEDRYYWADVCNSLRQVLIRTEEISKKELGTDTGVWIEELNSYKSSAPAGFVTDSEVQGQYNNGPDIYAQLKARYDAALGGSAAAAAPPTELGAGTGVVGQTAEDGGDTEAVEVLNLVCRGVSLARISASANSDIAFTLQQELRNNPLFDAEKTKLKDQINADETSGTFTFGVEVVLKNPLNL